MFCGIVNGFSGVFCEVAVVQKVAVQRCCIQNEQGFFLPHDEADGPGLQGRDLNNSQTGALPKSVLLYCVLCEISQKAR